MNFLCHAIPYLEDPVVTIGTGIPDLIRVVDRRLRAREQHAMKVPSNADDVTRRLAQGIIHHHRDDHWFHSTADFAQTNLELAVRLRDSLPGDNGFRPMFVGHIVIEMLLDGFWVRDRPDFAERYYQSFEAIAPRQIQSSVEEIIGRPAAGVDAAVQRFQDLRFLYDYPDPERMLVRLNQVMRRVGLAQMSQSVLPWLQEASDLVESRRAGFLTRSDGSSLFPPLP